MTPEQQAAYQRLLVELTQFGYGVLVQSSYMPRAPVPVKISAPGNGPVYQRLMLADGTLI